MDSDDNDICFALNKSHVDFQHLRPATSIWKLQVWSTFFWEKNATPIMGLKPNADTDIYGTKLVQIQIVSLHYTATVHIEALFES